VITTWRSTRSPLRQDGLIDKNGYVLNDETHKVLGETGHWSHAEAGGRRGGAVGHDGRANWRHSRCAGQDRTREHPAFSRIGQVCVELLRPVPRSVGSAANLAGGINTADQMDCAFDEALREVALDLEEGADMVIGQARMPYLDIGRRVKDEFGAPNFGSTSVSGEYAMLMAAAQTAG